MANNYVQFSLTIKLVDKERADWWRKVQAITYDWAGDEDQINELTALGVESETLEYSPCTIDVEADDSEVWLYTDESGDTDETAGLIRSFLAKFNIDDPVSFEVAFTCSKPRPDEFGGAAFWITKDGWEAYGTGQWVAEKYAARAKETK